MIFPEVTVEDAISMCPGFARLLPAKCLCGADIFPKDLRVAIADMKIFLRLRSECSCGAPKPFLFQSVNSGQLRDLYRKVRGR